MFVNVAIIDAIKANNNLIAIIDFISLTYYSNTSRIRSSRLWCYSKNALKS